MKLLLAAGAAAATAAAAALLYRRRRAARGVLVVVFSGKRKSGKDYVTERLQALLGAGECDIAVVNTYYLGMMQGGDDADAREIAEQVAVFWPNQDGRGAHINISGAGVATNAPNPPVPPVINTGPTFPTGSADPAPPDSPTADSARPGSAEQAWVN